MRRSLDHDKDELAVPQPSIAFPSRLSESPFRVAFPSRLSESPFRVALPSRLSESPLRVGGLPRVPRPLLAAPRDERRRLSGRTQGPLPPNQNQPRCGGWSDERRHAGSPTASRTDRCDSDRCDSDRCDSDRCDSDRPAERRRAESSSFLSESALNHAHGGSDCGRCGGQSRPPPYQSQPRPSPTATASQPCRNPPPPNTHAHTARALSPLRPLNPKPLPPQDHAHFRSELTTGITVPAIPSPPKPETASSAGPCSLPQ